MPEQASFEKEIKKQIRANAGNGGDATADAEPDLMSSTPPGSGVSGTSGAKDGAPARPKWK